MIELNTRERNGMTIFNGWTLISVEYKPIGHKDDGRPKKRWKDDFCRFYAIGTDLMVYHDDDDDDDYSLKVLVLCI
jgi:hypothetical protein